MNGSILEVHGTANLAPQIVAPQIAPWHHKSHHKSRLCVDGAHHRSERTTLNAPVWATDAAKNCDDEFVYPRREFGFQGSSNPVIPAW